MVAFRSALYPLAFAETVVRRWAKLNGIPGDVTALPEAVFRRMMNEPDVGSRYDAFRTFLNGRATSHWMHSHSDVMSPCRSGCTGSGDIGGDGMRHYVLGCQPLLEVADGLMPFQVGPLACLQRFGVLPCSPRRAAFLAHLYRAAAGAELCSWTSFEPLKTARGVLALLPAA